VRGAFNKALTIPESERGRGLVAVSGGNHAQAVAYVGKQLGVRSLIIMPQTTPRNYVEATREYGAEVVFAANATEAFDRVADYEREGWTSIHPFDDPLVIAGQGTAGLEIVEDVPQATDVIASIGGGGFIAGIACAVKNLKPGIRVWGVETEGADTMTRALAAGEPVKLPAITSIAKTLGVTVVPDSEAIAGLRFLLERAKILAEPAATCTLAAAERLRGQFTPSSHVVLVLCGGNLGIDDLCRLLQ